ncbi:MAG: thiamine biosynthesis protein ThiS [Thiotrichales bacterium]|nr:thiamine biosynthesis protein ThiS [Thiotrichales bacterium]|tara:strand:+ start:203 stop:403 length:201 start_codon:yes stop_codon:yes gene_type:complete
MNVIVNGAPRDTSADTTLADLVAALGLEGRRLAIEVNEEVIPRSEYSRYTLDLDDRVEIVQAIGGG